MGGALIGLVRALAAMQAARAMREGVKLAALSAIGLCALLAALGFATAAGYFVLRESQGTIAALLICAGAYCALAVAIALYVQLRRKRQPVSAMASLETSAAQLPKAIDALPGHAPGMIALVLALSAFAFTRR